MKFYTVKEISQDKYLLEPRNLIQTRKFSKNIFYLDQGSLPQTNIFTRSKNVSANQDQKGSTKAKISD